MNGVYDGYSFFQLYLGHSYATNFSHYHDFEPTSKNHSIPHHGIASRLYFDYLHRTLLRQGEKYSNFKKTSGPPHYSFNPVYMPLEEQDYAKRKGLTEGDVKMFEPKTRVEHQAHH